MKKDIKTTAKVMLKEKELFKFEISESDKEKILEKINSAGESND